MNIKELVSTHPTLNRLYTSNEGIKATIDACDDMDSTEVLIEIIALMHEEVI